MDPVPRIAAAAAFAAKEERIPSMVGDKQKVDQTQQEISCARLRGVLSTAVLSEQVRRLGVSVSDTEADEEWQAELKRIDLEAEAARARRTTAGIAEALSRVYDRGENPENVFAAVVAPLGYSKGTWQVYLTQGGSEEFRNSIARRQLITVETIAVARRSGLRHRLELRKLAAAVDDELTNTDSVFGTYVAEMRNSQLAHPDHDSFTMDGYHYRYIKAGRQTWWQARYIEANGTLNDSSLAARCAVGDLGAEIARQVR
jgi:hypothetical protein